MASLLQKLSRAVWGTSPQNTTLDIDPVSTALGTTSSVYAGITRAATTTWWNCGNTAGPTTASANLNLALMMTEYGRVTYGNEEPDTVIFTQTGFNSSISKGLLTLGWMVETLHQAVKNIASCNFLFGNGLVYSGAESLK